MGTPDPALGIAVDFPELDFRNGINFAMQMGRPNDPELAPTFGFLPTGEVSYRRGTTLLDPDTVRKDRDGRPLDPTIRVFQAPAVRLTVDCAIEINPVDAEELPVGNFRPSRANVTVLDTEWRKIHGCRDMKYNGDTYLFAFEPEVNGMFGVDVHTLVFYALKDS
jgi:hypothetical protein